VVVIRGWYAYGSPPINGSGGGGVLTSEGRKVVMVVSGGLTEENASRLDDLYVLEEVAARGEE